MKELTTLLSILLLLAACGEEITDEYSGDVAEIFQEISLSEKLNLYLDDDGQPAEGRFSATYHDGSPQAIIIFRDGMISDGEIFALNGLRTIGYSTNNGMMKQTYYTFEEQPRLININGDDLEDRREFHVWYENGNRLVKSDETMLKVWFENGQLQMKSYAVDGKTHGRVASWYENGQLKTENHFTYGEMDGTFTEWDEDGNIIRERVYDMGELVFEN